MKTRKVAPGLVATTTSGVKLMCSLGVPEEEITGQEC